MLRGFNDQGNARGAGIILDAHYRPVKQVSAAGMSTSCDLHEFSTANSGATAIVTQYRRRMYDGEESGRGLIWVMEGVFQELDLESGRVLFEWRSMDHVDPLESFARSTKGTRATPWDYFHLNSVEKMPDGNYLVSSRHTSTVFKVSAQDGTIMWRLGGLNSSFDGMDPPLLFQHHARVLSDEAQVTRLSIFDNARRPAYEPDRPSAGIIVRLDHGSQTAQVETRYAGPGTEYTIKVAGSTLVLPDENVLVGFGDSGCFTEYTKNGIAAMKACLRDSSRPTLYRVYKAAWTGYPFTQVSLVSYSRTNLSSTAFYVSWNGATEVREWRIFGVSSQDGSLREVSRAPKDGFETILTVPEHYSAAYVEAVSGDEVVLGKSAMVTTFVPSERTGHQCDDLWCAEPLECTVSDTSSDRVGHPLGLTKNWEHLPFAQAVLISLFMTPVVLLVFRLTRQKWRSASRISRLCS